MPDPPASGSFDPPEAGDRAWFAEAFRRLLPELYATARRLTRDQTDAEDLVADAVSRAWCRRDTLRDRGAIRTWMFRILSNTYLSARRAARARPAREDVDDIDAGDASFSLFERLHQPFLLWWGSPEQEFLSKLLREDIDRAIACLPQGFRVAVILADIQGMSYQEIGDVLRVPIGTVRSRLARGRALLQKALWQQGIDAGLVRETTPDQRGAHD